MIPCLRRRGTIWIGLPRWVRRSGEEVARVNTSAVGKGAGETVLERAEFDPKLRTYWFWNAVFVLVASIVGIVVLPFWILGFGQWWTRRQFRAMEAELCERSLNYRKGVLFKVEKTIPLEQIQDLTLREGPLLKALGLCSLSIETAGQSATSGSDARLTGVRDARTFRDAALARRDLLRGKSSSAAHEAAPSGGGVEEILRAMQTDLAAIRQRLESSRD